MAAVLPFCFAMPAHAENATSSGAGDPKAETYGAAMAVQYGIDHCDIETTLKQRTDVKTKIASVKQQAGITSDIPEADIKEAIGLKTDDDLKSFCTGLALKLPGMIADMMADRPTSDWGKPTSAAATPETVMVGDWEVEPVKGVPGNCMITRDYNDPEDKNAENTIVLRSGPDQLRFVLQYARWNMTSGQQFEAALVTPDGVIDSGAQWTVNKTGKIIQTDLKPAQLSAFKMAKQLIVKFDSGDATFEVPRIDDAIAALDTCKAKK